MHIVSLCSKCAIDHVTTRLHTICMIIILFFHRNISHLWYHISLTLFNSIHCADIVLRLNIRGCWHAISTSRLKYTLSCVFIFILLLLLLSCFVYSLMLPYIVLCCLIKRRTNLQTKIFNHVLIIFLEISHGRNC